MFDRTQEIQIYTAENKFVAEVKLYYKNKSLQEIKVLEGSITDQQEEYIKKVWGQL